MKKLIFLFVRDGYNIARIFTKRQRFQIQISGISRSIISALFISIDINCYSNHMTFTSSCNIKIKEIMEHEYS